MSESPIERLRRTWRAVWWHRPVLIRHSTLVDRCLDEYDRGWSVATADVPVTLPVADVPPAKDLPVGMAAKIYELGVKSGMRLADERAFHEGSAQAVADMFDGPTPAAKPVTSMSDFRAYRTSPRRPRPAGGVR